ncbi:hypothetical protein SAMN05414139_01487 [Burkholderia sp. D7]|nr:hypothetical protein SAMN05414139_01487 [Burkholderia sp. D7]
MARPKLKHAQLLSDLKSFGSDSFEPVRKVVRKTSLTKSQTVQEAMLKAGIDPEKLKPFTGKPPVMREKGATVGTKALVKGRQAVKAAPLPDAGDVGVPAALRHEHLKRAIVAHAAAHDDFNSPISEPMLNRVLKMAKAGQLTDDQARRTVEYHSKGLSLPTDVMHAIGGN